MDYSNLDSISEFFFLPNFSFHNKRERKTRNPFTAQTSRLSSGYSFCSASFPKELGEEGAMPTVREQNEENKRNR